VTTAGIAERGAGKRQYSGLHFTRYATYPPQPTSLTMTISSTFFAWFQAERELTADELAGIVRGLALLREEQSIYGWRITQAPDVPPNVALELTAENETDASIRASIMFVEAVSAAGLEGETGVFGFAEAALRNR
jgi:hypothetical protein